MTWFERLRSHTAFRFSRRAVKLTIAILAAAIVASLTIDLGPSLRQLAERGGTAQLKRPIHIGRLSVHILRGAFVLDDVRIDGVRPGDRPFFTAKRLELGLDWSTIFRRRPEIIISSVEMTDWAMLVEKFPNGKNNFPKFVDNSKPDTGPRRFTTTLKYLRAWRGRFTYDDHEVPWSVDGPNLDINITNLPQYHGTATFRGGVIQIQHHLPMWGNFRAQFVLDGPHVRLPKIDIETDGAETSATGEVDFSHWPDMKYDVKSRVHFARMREIFFTDEKWRLSGDGDFVGTFRLYDGGHNLRGAFASQNAGLDDFRFPGLYGTLQWNEHGFDVWNAGSRFFGGDAKFQYSIKPLGKPEPAKQRFDVILTQTQLAPFSDLELTPKGQHFSGTADAHVYLEWPSGKFNQRIGGGSVSATPPPGVALMGPSLASVPRRAQREWGPFAPIPLAAHLPIGGQFNFTLTAAGWAIDSGVFRTEKTHVLFDGVSDWHQRGRFNFHAVMADFQEADQLLAGIITDFGSPTGVVPFGGRGQFDGTMTGAFNKPRVEGKFSGEDLWAWDTLWGEGGAQIAIENSYVDIKDGVVRLNGSEIHTDGKFSLGYPRGDGGDEIDARFRIVRRDVASLRHAFQIDEYPVNGFFSGEMHLTGPYQRPIGFGAMTIEDGTAYGMPMRKAAASLRFDGRGIRLDAIDVGITSDTATRGGGITGAAFIGWDATYSFNAAGRGIPLSSVAGARIKSFSASGTGDFTADGSGTFDAPRNNFKFRVVDAAVGEQPVGEVTGTLSLRGNELSGDINAASPTLALTGAGRVALNEQGDCELSFRFHDSSIDPYVRLFLPNLSPYTTAVTSGSVRIVGELADVDHLVVDTTVDALDMRLFDYALRNDGPIHMTLDQRTIEIHSLQLAGVNTSLKMLGKIDLRGQTIGLQATGNADLGILQGFFRDVRGSGRAELRAAVDGPLRAPAFTGQAVITNGRVRHLSLPNALDNINGAIRFDSRGIQLDEVTASMGGGPIQFGGRINLDGYLPGELNVLISGQDMHLRYPEGIQSVVDADLSVRGNLKAPVVGGTVNVQSAVWTRRLDAPGSIFDLASRAAASADAAAATSDLAAPVPMRFDLEIKAPNAFRVDTNLVQLSASADLNLRGTYDHPVLLGRAEVDRGVVNFEGRRYRVTRGTLDFSNPTKIEPFIDLEAETNVRAPGQTYRVVVSVTGTPNRLAQPALESDPPLPQAEVVALLLSDVQPGSVNGPAPELVRLRDPNRTETDILRTRATQALSNPLSNEVQRVAQETFGVDTFQVSPSFTDPNALTSRLNPTARVTIGKRISDRAYLTFSRSLNSTFNDQILLLEYEASDRFYWVFSRNEDQQTYALEFRVRHSF
ncbi:MAG TPA: translocation/assembly module TamB domain-containing protein [Vicinamibacterales bacterium]|nr:translocation/assembly module TamB domain-containing protein [Vicinamibacterales bacterium]